MNNTSTRKEDEYVPITEGCRKRVHQVESTVNEPTRRSPDKFLPCACFFFHVIYIHNEYTCTY